MQSSRRKTARRRLLPVIRRQNPKTRTVSNAFIQRTYGGESGLCDELTAMAILLATGNPNTHPSSINNALNTAEHSLMEHILSDRTLDKWSRKLSWALGWKDSDFSLAEYNAAIRYQDILVQTIHEELTAARLWWLHMARLDPPPRKPHNSRMMVQMIQDELQITPQEWSNIRGILESEDEKHDPGWETNFPPLLRSEWITAAGRAMTGSGTGSDTCPAFQNEVIGAGKIHWEIARENEQKGWVWKTWTDLLNRMAQHHQNRPSSCCNMDPSRCEEGIFISETARHFLRRIRQDEPWGPDSLVDLLLEMQAEDEQLGWDFLGWDFIEDTISEEEWEQIRNRLPSHQNRDSATEPSGPEASGTGRSEPQPDPHRGEHGD